MTDRSQPLESDAVVRFMRQHVRRGTTAIDVGANQGLYTVLLGDLVGPEGRVFAFEPVEEARATLEARTSEMSQIVVLPFAVADKPGTRRFHIDVRPDLGYAASSLFELQDMEDKTELRTVECVTLDDFCTEHGVRPSFIKVDVEGAEPLVFAGAERLLLEYRPIIVYDLWETWWERGHAELWRRLSRTHNLVRLATRDSSVSNVGAWPTGAEPA